MRDYKLSEVKAICSNANIDCENCEFNKEVCTRTGWGIPEEWDVEETPTTKPSKQKPSPG